MFDLAIQIVNYRTKAYVESLLEDIFLDLRESPLRYEVLILDNDSGDRFHDLEFLHRTRPLHFFYLSSNDGFGAGHNFLARQSSSTYQLILNPDLNIIEAKTIERSIRSLQSHGAGIMGPLLINKDGIQPWDHGDFSAIERVFGLWSGSVYYKRKEPLFVAWVSGAFLLTKRNVFDAFGGFDQSFFLYKEDEDLCFRARELGHTILYDPTIRVFHHGGVVAQREKFFTESNQYYIKKHLTKKRCKNKLIFHNLLKLYLFFRSKFRR